MYQTSKLLHSIIEVIKPAARTNLFRYKLIVDVSERKEDCPYAKQAERLFKEESEAKRIKIMIADLRMLLDQLEKLL